MAELDGEVSIKLDSKFKPVKGKRYSLLTASEIKGNYSNVKGNEISVQGKRFEIAYTKTEVVLTAK
jgi:hypothetical protein